MSHLTVDSNMKCTLEYRKFIQILNSVTNTMQETGKRLIIRPIPEYLFQCVGLDIMTLGRKKYLVCMEYFSRYTLFDQLLGTKSVCTVKLMKKHFMRYSIPEEVVTDGGPEFDNQMMKRLACRYGFRWNSPDRSSTNGIT